MKTQEIWSKEELNSLMDFVDPNEVTASIKMWALEKDGPVRSYNAAQFQYYTERKKRKAAAEKKAEMEKDALTAYTDLFGDKEQNQEAKTTPDMPQQQSKSILNRGSRNKMHWSGEDDRNLIKYLNEGKSYDEAANLLFRSRASITTRISNLRNGKVERTTSSSSMHTLTPLTEYLAKHPELMTNGKQEALPQAQETLNSSIPTHILQKGTRIVIPVVISIENNALILTVV